MEDKVTINEPDVSTNGILKNSSPKKRVREQMNAPKILKPGDAAIECDVNGHAHENSNGISPAKKPKLSLETNEEEEEEEEGKKEVLEVELGNNLDGEVVDSDTVSEVPPPVHANIEISNGEESRPIKSVKDLEAVCPTKDKTLSYYLNSGNVPKMCTEKECILGIDEAGRGPVLGPMVYGIAYVPKEFESDLKDTGCNDSKALTEEKRETIFDKMCSLSDKVGWEADVISPTYISNCMLRRQKTSLNEISHNAAITLVQRALAKGAKISEIFVDTVGPAEKYQDKLQAIFTEQTVTVRSKADAIYPIVGAASIVAKVARDVAIRGWTMTKRTSSEVTDSNGGEPWGSGYPSDPVTKTFLSNTMDPIFGFDDIVRFSWSTAEKILEEQAVSVDWEDEEMSSKAKGVPKIRSYFTSVDLTAKERHRFFKERQLSSVTNF